MIQREQAKVSDWSYWTCPLDTAAESFGPFAGLVETWQSRARPAGRLPSRSDFEFDDFAGWMGRIFIANIEQDPFDVRFALWGTVLTQWWGADYTGKTLGQFSENPDSWATERRYFEAMVRQPFIGLAGGLLSRHRRRKTRVLGLDLPMSDGNGVNKVLSAHMRIGTHESAETILPACPRSLFANDVEQPALVLADIGSNI